MSALDEREAAWKYEQQGVGLCLVDVRSNWQINRRRILNSYCKRWNYIGCKDIRGTLCKRDCKSTLTIRATLILLPTFWSITEKSKTCWGEVLFWRTAKVTHLVCILHRFHFNEWRITAAQGLNRQKRHHLILWLQRSLLLDSTTHMVRL